MCTKFVTRSSSRWEIHLHPHQLQCLTRGCLSCSSLMGRSNGVQTKDSDVCSTERICHKKCIGLQIYAGEQMFPWTSCGHGPSSLRGAWFCVPFCLGKVSLIYASRVIKEGSIWWVYWHIYASCPSSWCFVGIGSALFHGSVVKRAQRCQCTNVL